jgi:membrane protein YdbS with pleckstrin-like domain
MGISAKLLGEGEQVYLSMRTHWKIMIGPVVLFFLTLGAALVLYALVPSGEYQQWLQLLILVAAVLGVLVYSVWPTLNWVASTYAVTDRRLITRHGVITRTGRDIPLTRINDVSSERGLLDRVLGCGTLVVWSAGEQGKVILPDVPHVETVQRTLSELVFYREDDDDETPERQQRAR